MKKIFLFCILLRIAWGFWSLGFDHPNEPYRLLEPIAHLDGFSASLPWEWRDGLLSTLSVRAHREVLHFVSLFGLSSALAQLTFLHVVFALASIFTWIAVFFFSSHLGATRGWAILAALSVALWPESLYHSTRLMDYSLEAILLSLALLAATRARFLPWAGAFLGASFFIRPQSGLSLIALALVLLTQPLGLRARLRSVGMLVTGYALSVGALGLLEKALGGAPFLVFFRNYLHFNWSQGGAARVYGSDPWHRYLTDAAKYYGLVLWLPIVGLSLRTKPARQLSLLAWLPFVVHMLIAHKEARFLYGTLWLLLPAAVLGLEGLRLRKSVAVALGVCAALGFVVSAERVSRRFFLQRADVIALAKIGQVLDPGPGMVEIVADPVFTPVGFLLRHRGPVCYSGSARAEERCTDGVQPAFRIERDAQGRFGLRQINGF